MRGGGWAAASAHVAERCARRFCAFARLALAQACRLCRRRCSHPRARQLQPLQLKLRVRVQTLGAALYHATRYASHLADRLVRPRCSLLTNHQQVDQDGHGRFHLHPQRLRVPAAAAEVEGHRGDAPSPKHPCAWRGTATSSPP